MQQKFYVEAGHDGSHQFVRMKRKDSHHHHRHHRRADDLDERLCRSHSNCIHVPLDEWNGLVRSERKTRQAYEALKGSLDGAMDCAEKERRAADKERRESSRLRREMERLARDRDCLAVEVRELRRARKGGGEIERAARAWQERFEWAQVAIEEKVGTIEALRDEVARQGRMLRRHRIVG